MIRVALFRAPSKIWLRAALIGLCYFVAAAITLRFTRFDGGAASLWISSAVLIAELAQHRPYRWMPSLIACAIASIVATGLYGVGPMAGFAIAPFNIGEAMIAALALRRLHGQGFDFGSLGGVTAFAVIAGIIAPALTGIGGAGVIAAATHMPYGPNWLHWYAGHALGNITFAPIMILVLSGEFVDRIRILNLRRRIEGIALTALMIGIDMAAFGQTIFPVLFVPLLPMVIAAFRFGRLGGAISIVVLAVIGAAFTLHGQGPVFLANSDTTARALFFQFYLGVATLMTLPVAAELNQRKALFQQLRASEARYRLIADGSTDVILNLGTDGTINYASPSVAELGGYDPAALLGSNSRDLVLPEDQVRVAAVHAQSLATPNATFIVEYRALTATGETLWCETHTRSITDEDGQIIGVVSAIRDISRHKDVEAELSRAAHTDALTGLVNRRAFDAELDSRIEDVRAGRGQGCCAVLDLDLFKQVNDQHGHEAGDRVLRLFAVAARKSLRDGDLIARLGGEEFGVILWGATIAEAHMVCDRLRQEVANMTITAHGRPAFRITVSGGIAAIDANQSRASILREADDALYRAKNAGRNRLALAA